MSNLLNIVVGILIGLVSLSLMMLLHELGHYVAGRLLGFKIIEFSLFMGPRIFSRVKNDIRYSIKSLPIGASVEFAGEYPEMDEKLNPNQIANPELGQTEKLEDESLSKEAILERDKAAGIFYAQAKWKRFIVMAAGPTMNLITGFLAFVIYFAPTHSSTTQLLEAPKYSLAADLGIQAGDKIVTYNGFKIKTDMDIVVAEKFPASEQGRLLVYEHTDKDGTVSQKQGYLQDRKLKFLRLNVIGQAEEDKFKVIQSQNDAIQVGDVITSIDGKKFTPEARVYTGEAEANSEITSKIKLLRAGKKVEVDAKQTVYAVKAPSGLYLQAVSGVSPAIGYAWNYCFSVAKSTYYLLGLLFKGMLPVRDAFAGPVGIVNLYSQINSANFVIWEKLLRFVQMFALISLSLGICNFIPLPPLDGSQIFLLAIEAIRGKRLSEKWENLYGYLGLALVLGLALFTLYLDIARIFNH